MSCPTDEELCAFAEGICDSQLAASLSKHIDTCSSCRRVVGALAYATRDSSLSFDTDVTPQTIQTRLAVPASKKKAPSRQIGRFIIDRELGSGGMGAVHLATDPKLNRQVAVKILHANMSADYGSRLRSEARAMAGLSHPNIIPVYEVGEDNGTVFIAMEYVPGRNLRQWLRTDIPDWREVVRVFVEAGRGLAAAHEQGLIHRDFKPDNVLIGDDGRVRVADFGLAKWIDAERLRQSDPEYAHTGAHSIMGTPGYIAPEQIETMHHTPSVDQFSFCVAFFEALFRRRPFEGSDFFECHEALLDKQITPVSLGPIPAKLHALVCRGLKYRPKDRFVGMAELLIELKPFCIPEESDEHCPFPGLSAFSEHDSKFYFGHEEAMNEALAGVATRTLLTIVGPSGAGKSSFVRAGLLPKLNKRKPWTLISMRPGHSPMRSLSQALGSGMPAEALLARAEQSSGPILLLIDQFEELFTQCADANIQEVFIRTLLSLHNNSSWGCLVLCLRSDFLDELGRRRRLARFAMKGLVYLSPPDRHSLNTAIIQPLDLVRYTLEDSTIAESLSEELADRPGALPLLQFAMAHLWKHRDRELREITCKAHEAMGDVGDLLASHADRVMASLPRDRKTLVKNLLLRLITVERTRDSASIAELRLVADAQEVDALLAVLVEARLLVVRRDEDGDFYELIHEALISNWPTLGRWLDQQREDHGYLREVADAAKQWEARQRADGLLWRDDAADELAAWHKRDTRSKLSAQQSDFVSAVLSTRLSTRRRKRQWVITALVSLGLVTAGAVTAATLIANARSDAVEQARQAKSAAQRAQAAEKKVRGQYQQLQDEIVHRKSAEALVVTATDSANLSREQLVEALELANIAQGAAEKSAQQAESAAARQRAAAQAADKARQAADKARQAADKARKETQTLLREKSRELQKALQRRKQIIDDL